MTYHLDGHGYAVVRVPSARGVWPVLCAVDHGGNRRLAGGGGWLQCSGCGALVSLEDMPARAARAYAEWRAAATATWRAATR